MRGLILLAIVLSLSGCWFDRDSQYMIDWRAKSCAKQFKAEVISNPNFCVREEAHRQCLWAHRTDCDDVYPDVSDALRKRDIPNT